MKTEVKCILALFVSIILLVAMGIEYKFGFKNMGKDYTPIVDSNQNTNVSQEETKFAIIKSEITIDIRAKNDLSMEDLFIEFNNLNKNATLVIIDSRQRIIKKFSDITSAGTYTVKVIDVANGKTYQSILKVTDASNTKPSTPNTSTNESNTSINDNLNQNTNNKPIQQYNISFVCNCNQNYPSVTVKEGELITAPNEPKKNGYTFKYWSYNGKPYDFSTPITSNIVLKAEFQEVKWTVLWIFLSEINSNGNVSRISRYEMDGVIEGTGKKFERFIEQHVDTNIVNTYVYETDVIRTMGYENSFGPTLSKKDVLKTLEKFNYQKYDSVMVIGNMDPYRSQMTYGGLTWGWDQYSFCAFFDRFDSAINWHELFIHEWIHQLESWYGSLGYTVPVLHDNKVYGFYEENENGWLDWYEAYLTNQLTGGPATGIHKDWWKYTPTSGLRP